MFISMIGLAELLLIAAIILLIFGTTRLSRAAETTKAAVKVGKKRHWVTNPVTGEKELTLMSVEKELTLGKRTDAEVRQKWGLYEDPALQHYVQEIALKNGFFSAHDRAACQMQRGAGGTHIYGKL